VDEVVAYGRRVCARLLAALTSGEVRTSRLGGTGKVGTIVWAVWRSPDGGDFDYWHRAARATHAVAGGGVSAVDGVAFGN